MKQDLRSALGGGGNRVTPVNSGFEKPGRGQKLYPRPCRESGFAYGRSEASPDSEQIEHVIAEQFMRNSVSVEQIQDRVRENKSSAVNNQNRGGQAAFTKPSRGMSEAKGEQESAETSSFRCDCERCCLSRGAVDIFKTKAAFTLAEGATHVAHRKNSRKAAFTLAEVLITLGIIGVVAALTMPALITNIQDRIQAKRIENINQKLSKVTDKMAVQSGLTGYGTTMAFVQEMSKHMKIAKICDNEHLAECWPTQEVTLNDEGKTWEIAKTKNAKTLKISNNAEDWADTVGIVTGDGTGMILSYNKKCEFNVDDVGLKYDSSTGKSNSLGCISGVFDWNGSSKPNKLGKDVTMLAPASGLGNNCAIEAGGKCFTAAFTPTPLTRAQCEAEKDKLGISQCCPDEYCNGNDYWAGAVKQCGGVSKMPTMADLAKLATELYKEHPSVGARQNKNHLTLDTSKASSMGFTDEIFAVWSGEENSSSGADIRLFRSMATIGFGTGSRPNSNYQAVCLGD